MPTAKEREERQAGALKGAAYTAGGLAFGVPGLFAAPGKPGRRRTFPDEVSGIANRNFEQANAKFGGGDSPKLQKLKAMAEGGTSQAERDAFKARYDKLKADQPKAKKTGSWYKAKAAHTAFKTPQRAHGVMLGLGAASVAAGGAAGYRSAIKEQERRKVKKSAFLGEPNGYFRPIEPIEKAYRDSYLQGINPRSKTKVKEGSMGRRGARFVGGAVAGQVVGTAGGAVVGRGNPLATKAAGSLGAATGATIGRSKNISSGDTVARRRSDGKKAKGGVTIPGIGSYWRYS